MLETPSPAAVFGPRVFYCQVGLVTMLCEQNQVHLMGGWPMPGTDDNEKHRFFKQARHAH